jgi:hypothetical protein
MAQMTGAVRYNLKQVAELQKKIVGDPLMWPHYNATLTGEDFAAFVHAVGQLLGNTVDPRVLEESCISVLGKEMTGRRLNAFALRIAANIQRLRAGEVVLPWTRQVEEEWAPVEVLRCWPGRSRKDVIGSHFQLLVLAGTPVGLAVATFWTQAQCNYIGIELGFSRRRKRPLIHPSYMVRLRFSALFEPRLSAERPGFHKVRLPPGLARYNEPLMRDRFHREPGCPPRGYEHFCHACWLGYDTCPMAVHPTGYVQHICDRCADPRAWHDPADDLDMCINCAIKIRLRPKEAK